MELQQEEKDEKDTGKLINPLDRDFFAKMTKKSTKVHICKNTDFSCENNHKKLYIFWNLITIPSQWLNFFFV